MLGVRPRLGRDFAAEEETPGKNRVVILNHGLWQRRFGRDPNIVGQKVTLSGEPYIVAGVLPDIPHVIQSRAEMWTPLVLTAESSRGVHFLSVLARLKPGVTLARARAEMDAVAGRLEQHYPNETPVTGSTCLRYTRK